jgi:hypothetical protein
LVIMAACAIVGTVLALFLRETAPIRLARQARLSAAAPAAVR